MSKREINRDDEEGNTVRLNYYYFTTATFSEISRIPVVFKRSKRQINRDGKQGRNSHKTAFY